MTYIPPHTHTFVLPTATLEQAEARERDDLLLTAAVLPPAATAEQGVKADTALQPDQLAQAIALPPPGQASVLESALETALPTLKATADGAVQRIPSFASASTAFIPSNAKRVCVEFYAPNYVVPATLTGAAHYKPVPTEPSHDLKFNNGGWWEIDEVVITPDMAGAVGDGVVRDDLAIGKAARYLNTKGGGWLRLLTKTYLCEEEIEIPCGVHIMGPGELCFNKPGGNGIYVSTNVARKGQHSNIHDVTISRLGTNGGKGIYTRQSNAPFQTQSPYFHVERCFFRQSDAQYTYPPAGATLQSYAWLNSVDLAHSNGSVVRDNDILGNFDATLSEASQSFKCVGVHLGTEPSNTSGVIAADISNNRIWYQHAAFVIGEDVLAFWFEKNECIKCYRGVWAPSDPGGDGTVLQADTRITDNHITTAFCSIDLSNRQLFHVDDNHLSSDAAYYDNGLGWTGLKLENCSKFRARDNFANLAAGHHAWAGDKRAFSMKASSGGTLAGNEASGYINDMVYLDTCDDMSFAQHRMLTGSSWPADSKAGYAFAGVNTNIRIGDTSYSTTPPLARYRFDDAGTTIESLAILADKWVVPSPVQSAVPVSGFLTVDRSSVAVTTTSAPQTVTSIVGLDVRNGCRLRLRASSSANALTVTDGSNLRLAGNFVSLTASSILVLEYDATFGAFVEISRAFNG